MHGIYIYIFFTFFFIVFNSYLMKKKKIKRKILAKYKFQRIWNFFIRIWNASYEFSLFFLFFKKKVLIVITLRFITLVTRFNFSFEKHGKRRNFNF